MSKFTALIYGEGRKDKNFLKSIISLGKFCWHTKNWTFQFANASGESPRVVLEKCKKKTTDMEFDLIICFIDLDVLKKCYPKKWKEKVTELEREFNGIHGIHGIDIFWHEDNLEDELEKILGETKIGKTGINNLAKKTPEKFINSEYWNKLLTIIKNREQELINNSENNLRKND